MKTKEVYYLSKPDFDKWLVGSETIELIMKYCNN